MKLTPLQRFWRLLRRYRAELNEIYGYAIFNGLVNLSLPLGIQAIIAYLQTREMTSAWIVLVVVVLTGIALMGTLQVMQLKVVEKIQQDIFARSGIEFAFRIPNIQAKAIRDKHLPELANRFFDTLTIQKGLPKILIDFSLATFQIFFGLILLSIYSPYFIFLIILLFLLLYLIMAVTGPKGLETSLKESKQKYRVAHLLEEVSRAFLSFKQYSHKKLHLHKADDITVDYLKARKAHFNVLQRQFWFFVGFKVLLAASFLILGGVLVFNNRMNIGQFVAAEIIILIVINSMEKILQVIDSIYDVLTALEKIGAITDIELDKEAGQVETSSDSAWEIEAKSIAYQYPGYTTNAFEKVSFQICCNDRVRVVGKSASGKTTLLNVVAGNEKISKGTLEINQVPIQNFNKTFLNDRIGINYSANQLIEASYYENITFGRNIPVDEVERVLKALCVMEFIKHQPKGLNCVINSGGEGLPASVIEKLHLARAIIGKPKLLVLDNPIPNVNSADKEQIINFLSSVTNDWTIIVASEDEVWNKVCNKTIEV